MILSQLSLDTPSLLIGGSCTSTSVQIKTREGGCVQIVAVLKIHRTAFEIIHINYSDWSIKFTNKKYDQSSLDMIIETIDKQYKS
jgi:hypothetical protein